MARADTSTLLPIDTWGAIMGVSPWWLNQFEFDDDHVQCAHVMYQSPWSHDFLSREELARAMAKAEEMVAEELNFWPAPKYFTDEVHTYPRPYNRELYGYAGTPRYQWKAVQLNWGKVQAPGLMARTLVNAAAAVVLSDNDGDGVSDRFTVTVATSVTDPREIAAYFTLADRNGVSLDETWRIRPVNVVITGGNAVITGHPTLLAKPDLTTTYNPTALDPTVAANYVTTVEVYRLYTDMTTTAADPAQGMAMWELDDCDVPPCNVAWLPVCVGARNAEAGLVSVDFWLAGTQDVPSNREPDRVKLNYLAGYPLLNGHMAREMADIVAHLATGILPVGPCGCERSDRIISWWRNLPSQGEENQRPLSMKELDECAFGQSRGALWAWKRVQNLRRERVSLV